VSDAEELFAVRLGEGAECCGDHCVSGGQHLVDNFPCLAGQVDQDLAPIGGVRVALDQVSAFERIQ